MVVVKYKLIISEMRLIIVMILILIQISCGKDVSDSKTSFKIEYHKESNVISHKGTYEFGKKTRGS